MCSDNNMRVFASCVQQLISTAEASGLAFYLTQGTLTELLVFFT